MGLFMSEREKVLEEKIEMMKDLHKKEVDFWKERGDRYANNDERFLAAMKKVNEDFQGLTKLVLSLVPDVHKAKLDAYKEALEATKKEQPK